MTAPRENYHVSRSGCHIPTRALGWIHGMDHNKLAHEVEAEMAKRV